MVGVSVKSVCDTGLHAHGSFDLTHRLNASGRLFLCDIGGGKTQALSSAFEFELRTTGEEKWFN